MYFDIKTNVEGVASLIGRDTYFTIRSNLKRVFDYEVSSEEKNKDKWWKVVPLLKSVGIGCLFNPRP